MKKLLSTALFTIVCIAGQAQVHYRLEGTIGDSLTNTKLLLCQYMSAIDMVNATLDTVEVVNGKMLPIEGTLKEPATFSLRSITQGDDEMPEIQSPIFFLENGSFRIHFNPQKMEYIGPDSPLNRDFVALNNAVYPILHVADKQQELDSLMRSELTRHADDVVGIQVIAMVFQHVKPKYVASWLELMSPRVKAGDVWNEMKLGLSALGVNMELPEPSYIPDEGEPFVDFAVEYEGKTVRLSDYVGKGKYVLVDFWASWCGPCRGEIPYIIAAYDKYKDKGFEVLGIAAWDDPRNSLKALKEDGVTYPQILNSQEIAAKAYHLRGIPHIILFAPDGTIVARGLRGDRIEEVLAKIFK